MKNWPAKTAIFFVVIAIGGMALLALLPWGRMLGFERFEVGLSGKSSLRSLFLEPFRDRELSESIEEIQDRIEQSVLQEVPIGTPVKDVQRHIHKHFTDPNLERKSSLSGTEEWHYRLEAVLEEAFPGTARFTLSYTFRNDVLEAVSAYYSYAAL